MTQAISSSEFREALAHFASGVVIVTAHSARGPVGFTASAFASVSLEPPLVLVCVGRQASSYPALLEATLFGVSILSEDLQWVAKQFARSGVDRFEGVRLEPGAPVPLVAGTLAQLVCRPETRHQAGDHCIVVGEVVASAASGGRPLVHYARQFGAFTPDATPRKAGASNHAPERSAT